MHTNHIRAAIIAYSVMAIAAFIGSTTAGEISIWHHPTPWIQSPSGFSVAIAALLGLIVGGVGVWTTQALVQRAKWAQDLHIFFRGIVSTIPNAHIAALAMSSALAEELLFRGVMQPRLGICISSLIFGVLHVGPLSRTWMWTVWAMLMGFILGGLYAFSGNLLAPILAHAIINYENMHFIKSYDPYITADSRGGGGTRRPSTGSLARPCGSSPHKAPPAASLCAIFTKRG